MKKSLPTTARSLPIALIRAREVTMYPIRKMLVDTGLTEQQWRVLRVLSEHGPQDVSLLSERSCLLMPSLTRIATTMHQKGLITRNEDPSDRRRMTLRILPAGQQIIDDNLDAATEIVASFKKMLGEDDYEQLLNLLNKMTNTK